MIRYAVFLAILLLPPGADAQELSKETFWGYQCIDTMKYSRDAARAWNSTAFQVEIDRQLDRVKELGANCVAVGTPYDKEFVPYLTRWVTSARERGLKVWFRGNISGWEGWFNYPRLTSAQAHHTKISEFIRDNPNLFEAGDIFTPAPEPENGLLGDPRFSSDRGAAFRSFLVSSQRNCDARFAEIGKEDVRCGYFSFNGDVARESLNQQTVDELHGVIVIDHYIKNTARYFTDIKFLHEKYGAKVVLGEFGAPIPDIHGNLSEVAQAKFIEDSFHQFYLSREYLLGINYWVLSGGTTSILDSDKTLRQAGDVIKNYFMPPTVTGKITNTLKKDLAGTVVRTADGIVSTQTDRNGIYTLPVPVGDHEIVVEREGYSRALASISLDKFGEELKTDFTLEPADPSFLYRMRLLVRSLLRR